MNNEQWQAIYHNDRRCDGNFYYALSTTKTVCRPSCTARTPNPKNVFIFYDVEGALQQGFRPCNRCKPEQLEWKGYKEELAEHARHYIEQHFEQNVTLKNLSRTLQKNPHYIHRSFKETVGMTPLQYLHKIRMDHAKTWLKDPSYSITNVGLDVGYSDSAHFSAKFKEFEGRTPKAFRKEFFS